MTIDEDTLREILRALMRLECPTVAAVSEATGICEQCVAQYLEAAETLGFVERG